MRFEVDGVVVWLIFSGTGVLMGQLPFGSAEGVQNVVGTIGGGMVAMDVDGKSGPMPAK